MAAALLASVVARADSTQGQLVYSFTYGSDQHVYARDQQMNMDIGYGAYTSGISDYHGTLDDMGTMTVDIVSRQPDNGLVVGISERGENTRRAPPATCVVYGDTRVICDPSKTVYQEEYTLLRFLGTDFVNPAHLDAKKHWAVSQNGANSTITADYTITSGQNANMQISETRSVIPNGGERTDMQTKIGYDSARAVPTSIDEYAEQRHDNGVTGSTITIYQTTLQLLSDSVPKS